MRLHRIVEGECADRGEQRVEHQEVGTPTFRSQEAEELAKGMRRKGQGGEKETERADIEV